MFNLIAFSLLITLSLISARPPQNGCSGFQCSQNRTVDPERNCIPQVWVCDGEEDCPDGDDEQVRSSSKSYTIINGSKWF